MVKGKTPKKSKKSRRLGIRKNKKSKNDAKTKRDRRKMPNRIARDAEMSITLSLPGFNEEDTVQEAIRQSPDMTKLLEENGGKLFVPVGPENNEGASAAASSQSRQRSNVNQHLQKLDDEYGKWAAAEYAMSTRDAARDEKRFRPQTPIGTFGDYMKEQEREDEKDETWKKILNKKAGTTYKTSEDDLPLNLFKGGKRKSRRRKKSRRRRKKSRRRKTKRKSRRRRK